MTDKLWKAAERRICAMLGGTRRGPTGRDESDCCHPWLAVEIKCRSNRIPLYLHDWMEQAEVNAAKPTLAECDPVDDAPYLPIVVWHEINARYQDALVVMRLSDFQEWFGNGDA